MHCLGNKPGRTNLIILATGPRRGGTSSGVLLAWSQLYLFLRVVGELDLLTKTILLSSDARFFPYPALSRVVTKRQPGRNAELKRCEPAGSPLALKAGIVEEQLLTGRSIPIIGRFIIGSVTLLDWIHFIIRDPFLPLAKFIIRSILTPDLFCHQRQYIIYKPVVRKIRAMEQNWISTSSI